MSRHGRVTLAIVCLPEKLRPFTPRTSSGGSPRSGRMGSEICPRRSCNWRPRWFEFTPIRVVAAALDDLPAWYGFTRTGQRRPIIRAGPSSFGGVGQRRFSDHGAAVLPSGHGSTLLGPLGWGRVVAGSWLFWKWRCRWRCLPGWTVQRTNLCWSRSLPDRLCRGSLQCRGRLERKVSVSSLKRE